MRLLAELAYFEENPTQSTRARFFPLFGASVNRSRDGENRMKGAKRQIERMELKKKKHIFFFKWHERKRIFLLFSAIRQQQILKNLNFRVSPQTMAKESKRVIYCRRRTLHRTIQLLFHYYRRTRALSQPKNKTICLHNFFSLGFCLFSLFAETKSS